MFGSKIFAEIKAVGGLVGGLGKDMADVKATIAILERDFADVKTALAEVRALTGHTASTATAVLANQIPAGAATTTVLSAPAGPASSAPAGPPSIQSELNKDVAAVNPMAGVKLP